LHGDFHDGCFKESGIVELFTRISSHDEVKSGVSLLAESVRS